MSQNKKKFSENGYLIINLGLSHETTNTIISDVNRINRSENKKLNPKIYHYNEYPRLIEGWKQSEKVKELALNQKVFDVLEELFGAKPIPFSTINFTKGPEQPLHSDYFHFGSMPELMLAGVWVALEDINSESGRLSIVPGSHKSPIVLPEDLGLSIKPKSMSDIKRNYNIYEDWVNNYINQNNLKVETPELKSGQALIWAANLFHGAGQIKNKGCTRYSQVTHYHFEGCEFFYNPNFSSRKKYVKRDISETKIG